MTITINGTSYIPELVDGYYEVELVLESAGRYPTVINYLDEWDDKYMEEINIQVFPIYFDLQELKRRCEEQGFKYAYGVFKNPTEPPHLCVRSMDSDNFLADDIVYKKKTPIQMDYTFTDKNIEEQNKIEDIILGDIPWEKSNEVYLSSEKVWQVSYFFELIGGN